jgi:hypothetical protein
VNSSAPTPLDEKVTNAVGVGLLGKRVRLVVRNGHATITKFPWGIRELLKRLGLLETLGLVSNTSSGRLEVL